MAFWIHLFWVKDKRFMSNWLKQAEPPDLLKVYKQTSQVPVLRSFKRPLPPDEQYLFEPGQLL